MVIFLPFWNMAENNNATLFIVFFNDIRLLEIYWISDTSIRPNYCICWGVMFFFQDIRLSTNFGKMEALNYKLEVQWSFSQYFSHFIWIFFNPSSSAFQTDALNTHVT